MAFRDLETYLNELVSICQAELPAKLAAIDAEKADGITLPVVPSADYYNVINEQVLYVSPFIYYGFSNIDSTSKGGCRTILEPTVFFEIAFDQDYLDGDSYIQVLRYTRALQEVFQENFKTISSVENLRVVPFAPIDIQRNDGTDLKLGGVQITTTMVT